MADDDEITEIPQTAVPPINITQEGVIIPNMDQVLRGRLADMAASIINGSGDVRSPQGQIALSETAILNDVYDKILILFNQINPDFSQGRFQDGIGQLYFMKRDQGRGTSVLATCYGRKGTIIKVGYRARDTRGNIYSSQEEKTIDETGFVELNFVNILNGAIPCSTGELNTILTPVSGWDRITNKAPGAIGTDIESASAFESRRRDSVAKNARNTDISILGALLETTNVLDAYVWSNRDTTVAEIGSTKFKVAPNSVYICVAGGSDADIAKTIFDKYNPSGGMVGDTNVIIRDASYNKPWPQYTMTWQRAKPLTIYFKVLLNNADANTPDIITAIKNRVIEVFNGTYEPEMCPDITSATTTRERIAGRISSSRYYSPVIAVNPNLLDLITIQVSNDEGKTWVSSITPGVEQVPVIASDSILVEYEAP